MNIVAISYSAALIAFAILGLLTAVSRRGRPIGLRVLIGCVVAVIWAACVIVDALGSHSRFFAVYISELARNAALLWIVFGIAGDAIPRWFRLACYLGALSLLAIALLRGLGIAVNSDLLLARSGILFAFAGLIALEQTSRNARGNLGSALRYLIFGFGIIFAYDLFLYAQAELLRRIGEETWMARGIVNALAVPLIAVAMRRTPTSSVDIFVSRHVVFYTGTFLAVGAYLVFVATGGYYVRNAGGTWGGLAQVAIFCGALIVLLTVLFSQAMRRRAMVFIAKHFYRNKYDYRVEWLRFVKTLSNSRDDTIRTAAIRAVAETMGSPGGALFMVDETERRFVPVAVWPEDRVALGAAPEVSYDEEIVRVLGDRQWIIDLNEYRSTPEAYQNIALPAWLEQSRQLRIVSPILELERLAGFILLEEARPVFNLTYEDRDLLKTLGRHIATHLAQHEANRRLAESRQFDAYNRLTAFMMHDLKNSIAQLNLIVTNAARHKRNPQFVDDTIATIANTSVRMTRLIEQLQVGIAHDRNESVGVAEAVRAAIGRCSDRQPQPTLAPEADQTCAVFANKEQLTGIVEHVIRNAQDASTAQRPIAIEIKTLGEMVEICVVDEGAGMSAEFIRDRLFRPFDSTKGSRGMGVGAYQVREYVLSLGGKVNVHSIPEKGTRFSLCIPPHAIK